MTRVIIAGVAIWALASIALRLWGEHVLLPSTGGTLLLLAVSGPLMFQLPGGVFHLCRVDQSSVPAAAAALVVPGMVLDAAAAIWFREVYPNMTPDTAGLFGGWLLFCNAMALAGATTLARRNARGRPIS